MGRDCASSISIVTRSNFMNKKTLRRWLLGEFSIKRLVRSVFFIYAFFCVYVFSIADSKIFLPPPASYQDNREILKLTSGDLLGAGKGSPIQISAVYLLHPKATYTILFAHGNAEDLGNIQPVLQKLYSLGFSVFAYDYRGYGTSQGSPSEGNAYRDIDTAYNYLTQTLRIPPKRIIVYGRSVGGGSAVDLAARESVGGLIMESSFTSAFRVIVPFPILPFDKFPNIDKINRVKCPVLVIHGKADDTIPFSHGEKLFAAAPQPKRYLWVDGAGHNDVMWVAQVEYDKSLREFTGLVEGLKSK